MAENLCVRNNCHACCIGPRLKLNLIEVSTLRSFGTVLIGLMHFNGRRNIPRGKDGTAYYDMMGECEASNPDGLCKLYGTVNKPQSCSALEPGSKDCLKIREEQRLGPLKY